MSQADVDRFVADLKSDATMMDELKGSSTGLASVVEFASSKGYDISIDEAKAYIKDQAKQELSDDQLDSVAGGKGHHHHSTGTTVQQTVEAVTTAEVVAEAAEAVVVAAEAAVVAT
ncbi:MAG: Nif11-like leader peptide family RiPP precursor [Alphaproteobacteria bacterium]|jgi:predicted ribosomally synthesized peptide with nif11-like leader|nr:Nif11-like leader peptide family RiPP precursor [Alphaproteobacteria bacterium]MDP6781143.1 Nif11-like leader peptide family RiPP precursor [Alphaproteobacteria bacterium]MDP7044177.1 Nif11-like leader peptide family RiPP precursor [Alphaproteobacteria bacterium]